MRRSRSLRSILCTVILSITYQPACLCTVSAAVSVDLACGTLTIVAALSATMIINEEEDGGRRKEN